MEFRPRNYLAEELSHALPRTRADDHPLSSSSSPPELQVLVTSMKILHFSFFFLFNNLSYLTSSYLFGCRESDRKFPDTSINHVLSRKV